MLMNNFVKYLSNERNYSSYTIDAYSSDLVQFFRYLDLECDVSNLDYISIDRVRAWIVYLNKNFVSARSINRKISSLKSFFNFCNREMYITINPTLKIKNLKESRKLPTVVSEKSLQDLFDTSNIFKKNFQGLRDRLILELLYQTGIRVGELINIKLKDYSFSKKELLVFGKRNKQRIIPLNNSMSYLLESYITARANHYKAADVDFLFISDSCKQSYAKMIYRIVNRYLSLVSSVQKKSPHILRHAFATHLLSRGADLNAIKDLLGHSSLLSTQVYTQVSSEKIKKVYKKSHPRG